MAAQSPQTQRTIGQLVVDATRDVEGLVRSEIALAKAEVQAGVKTMGKGAGIVGAAAFVAVFALLFLLMTLAYVLNIWLPAWAAFGIVTLVLLIVAGILGSLGVKELKRAKPSPERAIAEAKQTIAVLRP